MDTVKLGAFSALCKVVDGSGVSRRELSRRMLRSDNYLGAVIGRRSTPGLDLFVEVCDAAGWKVYAEREGERIEIVPEDS